MEGVYGACGLLSQCHWCLKNNLSGTPGSRLLLFNEHHERIGGIANGWELRSAGYLFERFLYDEIPTIAATRTGLPDCSTAIATLTGSSLTGLFRPSGAQLTSTPCTGPTRHHYITGVAITLHAISHRLFLSRVL